MNNQNLTLLSEGQIWGNSSENQLEVLRKYGTKAAISDLCVLTGSYLCEDTDYNVSDSRLNNLKGRTSWFWTRSDDNYNDVRAVYEYGNRATTIGASALVLFAQLCNLLQSILKSPRTK